MHTYTVHEPEGPSADRADRADELVFVKEGFSFMAAVLTPFWMLANGLWLALAVYIGAVIVFEGLFWLLGLGQHVTGWVTVAIQLLVGFEADSIHRWTLARRGYRHIGSVVGRDAMDCERRFFDAWLKGKPIVTASALGQGAGERSASFLGGRLGEPGGWAGRS
jgi:hypothetical protein